MGQDSEEQGAELYDALKTILGTIVVLYSPLSLLSLASLLRTPAHEAGQTLDGLHSILDLPKDQSRPIRLHHPSFRDFLLDENRCHDSRFLVDEKKAHESLADFCIQLMSKGLREDICLLHSSGTLAKDVTPESVRQCLPMELQYACLYWFQHLQKSETRLQDNGQVHIFLRNHFLHWLEATILMKTSEAVLALISLDSVDRSSGLAGSTGRGLGRGQLAGGLGQGRALACYSATQCDIGPSFFNLLLDP